MPATQPHQLALMVSTPALTANDGRPVAVVHAMERAVANLHIGLMISGTGQLIPLQDRDGLLLRESRRGVFPSLRSLDDTFRVSVTGWSKPAGACPGGKAQFEFHVALPLSADGIAAAEVLLEAVAEEARAFWGLVTPFSAGVDIARQTKNRPDDLEPPPRGLPVIKSPSSLPSPETPHRLGWLNHWSAEASRVIGFPDSARDADLLSRARRTSTGGWVVRLTESPLDLDDPAHLDALKRAYEHLPKVGGRMAP